MSVVEMILLVLGLLNGFHRIWNVASAQRPGRRFLRATGSLASSNGVLDVRPTPFRQRLDNFMNMQYYGNISIGGQRIPAIFDTGSFELIVASTRCKHCQKAPYNPTVSKTFRAATPSEVVEHLFGSGPVISELGYEDVKVGPLMSSGQAFYQIIKHDIGVLDTGRFDAIVGIAPEGKNVTQPSLLDKFHVTEFSFCLQPASLAPGWLSWGGDLTLEQKTSVAAALPIVGKHHWAVSMPSIMPAMPLSQDQIDAASTLFCGKGCAALLDSGTSLIAAPKHSLRGLEILLPKLNLNCSNFDSLPDLEVVLAGYRVMLPPTAYVVRLRGTSSEKHQAANLLHFKAEPSDVDQCVYGFMEVNQQTEFGPLWVFGMPFFRMFHTTFSNAPNSNDRQIFLMGATDDCRPQPPNIERVPGASSADPKYQGGSGGLPKMMVMNAVPPERLQRLHREPLTLSARSLRPPRKFDVL